MDTCYPPWRERWLRWFPLLVVAGGLLAYANSFSGVFVFDDQPTITANPKIHHLWPPWWAQDAPTRIWPNLTFALNYALGGFNVADFHAVNLLIHILAGLLLYGVVRRTLRLPRWQGVYDEAAAWLALAVALVWVVHPLQTESVTYITQRYESMMGLAYLGGLYLAIRGMSAQQPRWWLNGSLLINLLGLGTKEMIATLPIVICLYDRLFVSESWRHLWRARWKYYMALALAWPLFAMLSLLSMTQMSEGGLVSNELTPWRYLLTEAGVIVHYLRLAFVPYPLCLDYGWPLVSRWQEAVAPGLAVLGLAGATVMGIIRRRWWGFPGALFFLVLAPTSSIIPLTDAAFEHRMYLPLAAVASVVVVGGHAALARINRRRGLARPIPSGLEAVAWAMVVTLFILMTRARNQDYVSEKNLWIKNLQARPGNHRIYIGLTRSLLAEGRYAEAAQYASNLLARLPHFADMSRQAIEQHETLSWQAQMEVYYYSLIQNNLGAALDSLAHTNLALSCYSEALRTRPQNVAAVNNLASVFYQQGRTNEALRQWREALRHEPGNATAHFHMATVYEDRAQTREAARHYRAALRSNPAACQVLLRLGWLLVAAPEPGLRNGQEAHQLAASILQITANRSISGWELLGAAYAEIGQFENAVQAGENALRLARQDTAGARATGVTLDGIQRRIAVYRQHRTYFQAIQPDAP